MTLRIRAANPTDAGSVARVHIDTWKTAYAGIVPAKYLAALSYRARESWWADILSTGHPTTSSLVAETERGEVVGFATGGPESEGNLTYRGELYSIYLLEQYQRQGVGRRLVSALAQHLLVDGIGSMLVWVLEDNHPACQFYESLGGERINRKTVAIGGENLVETSFGWKDITGLAIDSAV